MRLLILLLMLSVAACAGSPPGNRAQNYSPPRPTPLASAAPAPLAPAAQAPVTRAQAEAWADCAISKAREFDDGRSDASTVARLVRSECRSLYVYKDDEDLDLAAEVVLRIRSSDAQLREAVTPAWVGCVERFLAVDETKKYSARVVATVAADECRKHFRGRQGQDVQIITSVVERSRSGSSGQAPIVVGPPQPLPPVDKRL